MSGRPGDQGVTKGDQGDQGRGIPLRTLQGWYPREA